MVSQTEYRKNQEAFKAAQMGGQAESPLAAFGGVPGGNRPAGPGDQDPRLTAGIIAAGAAAPALLGAGPAAAGAQSAAQLGTGAPLAAQAAGMNKILLRYLAGSTILTATLSALFSIPNNIIGKEVNKVASDLGIDVGNLKLLAFEQMYTTPVEDPKTGQWTFLFNDEKRLRERLAEAGVIKEDIDNRVIQLKQLRAANAEIIVAAGSLPGLKSQLQTGELPFSGARRLVEEQTKSQQAQQAAIERQRALTDQFVRETGLPANEFEVAQARLAGNPTAAELFELNRSLRGTSQPQTARLPGPPGETADTPPTTAAAAESIPSGGIQEEPFTQAPTTFTPIPKTELEKQLGVTLTQAAYNQYVRTGRVPV